MPENETVAKNTNTEVPTPVIHCYVISLDRSVKRWADIEKGFQGLPIRLIRVPAVDGKTLTLPDRRFDPFWFRIKDGKKPSNYQIACALSHLQAMQTFLDSDQEYALICEDDVTPAPGLTDALSEAIKYASTWDMLRVFRVRHRSAFPYVRLTERYSLATNITGMSDAGGYILNRKAAKRLLRSLVPVDDSFDAALFRGRLGIQEAALFPDGLSDNENALASTIENNNRRPRNIFHPLYWTARLNRLFTRIWRYSLQSIRLVRRSFYRAGKKC